MLEGRAGGEFTSSCQLALKAFRAKGLVWPILDIDYYLLVGQNVLNQGLGNADLEFPESH